MSIYLIWFLVGVSFFIAEWILPTFIMFFFGVGAIILSVITAMNNDLSVNSQVFLFALFSVISLVFFRNFLKNIFLGDEYKGKDKYSEKSIDSKNNIAIVSKPINSDNFGEIKYKGTFYKAESINSIDVGKKVKVVSRGDDIGTFYKVEEIIN